MQLKDIDCPICGRDAGYRVKYPQQIYKQDLDFTARKTPRHSHFRMVECLKCGLVYSSPIFPEENILQFYRESDFLDEQQLQHMAQDYLEHFRSALNIFGKATRLLEIGCGNGFFLKELERYNISEIIGVEPSKTAVKRASPGVRSYIINDNFHEKLFDKEYFDMVCIFQVIDHVVDLNYFLKNIHRVLRKGGIFLSINHNIRSWFPKLLGKKSTMYDIEHIHLFDLSTMTKILEKHNFEPLVVKNIKTSYCLDYVIKMFPLLPNKMKENLLSVLSSRSINNFCFQVSIGNMVAISKRV